MRKRIFAKKLVLTGVCASMVIAALGGCGVHDTKESENPTTTMVADKIENNASDENKGSESGSENESGSESESGKEDTQGSESDTTPENTADENKEEETRVSYEGDLNAISNEKITWGVGVHTYDDGRPVSPVQLQEAYGDKYAVEFIQENEKKIYLTFDEGYENGYTGQILDVLKEKNVKAVFFVTMPYVKSEEALIRRMIDEGHIVGAHSVTHPSGGMPSLTVEQQIAEYKDLEAYVLEHYGYEMTLFRPPTGAFSEQSLAVAQHCGYTSVMWSFAYYDYNVEDQMEVSQALSNAVDKLHNGAIYLLHAVSKTNTEMLGAFIDQTIQKGYTFAEYK